MNSAWIRLQRAALGEVEDLARLDEGGWSHLAAQAALEGLEGLLYRHCRSAGIDLPPRIAAQLHAAYRDVAARNLFALQELGQVREALAARGLEVLVLPGAALLPLYPDPGCRPMDDVDLWVEPGAKREVAVALRAAGFVNPRRYGEVFVRPGLVLDLHVDLLNCGRIRSRRLGGWIDPTEVWRDRKKRLIEGSWMDTPSEEDAALYTAVHALRHSFQRFTWFVDLNRLLQEGLDWKILKDKAQRYHLERPFLYSLRFLSESLHRELPLPGKRWLEQLSLRPGEEWLLARAFEERPQGTWGDLLWAYNVEDRKKRLWFLAETCFPRPAVLLQIFPRLPPSLLPLAYGLRLGQLLYQGGRQLVGLARRG